MRPILFLLALSLTQLSGCCCCCGGNNSGGGGGGGWGDDLRDLAEEKVAEELTEYALEQGGHLEGVEIDSKTGTLSVTGPDGTLDIATTKDGAEITMSTPDGEFTLTGGSTAEIPPGFPLTAVPGATPTASTTLPTPEGTLTMVVLAGTVSVESAKAYYRTELGRLGTIVELDTVEQGQRATALTVNQGGQTYNVVVTASDGLTQIALTVAPSGM